MLLAQELAELLGVGADLTLMAAHFIEEIGGEQVIRVGGANSG